jgi:hypothetical protein
LASKFSTFPGRKWKLLLEQEREIYDKKAADDKERYQEVNTIAYKL